MFNRMIPVSSMVNVTLTKKNDQAVNVRDVKQTTVRLNGNTIRCISCFGSEK